MKILQTKTAPNPRRVRIFLAEKGIEVPFEELDLLKGAEDAGVHASSIRFQRVPVLVLDDGTPIAETMAICRYFEETKPEPALFGKGAKQRAHRGDVEPAHGAGAAGLRRRRPSAICIRPRPSSRCRRCRPGARPTSPRRRRSCSSSTRSWQAALHCRRRLFGRRHHRAGGGRFHEAGQGGAAARPQEPGALA